MEHTPQHKAFTLAEVLITLGIIGIVAAITIPTLVNTYQDIQYQNAYKKAYAISVQAISNASANKELEYVPSTSTWTKRNVNFFYFRSYFKVIKDCGTVDSAGVATVATTPTDCWAVGDFYDTDQPTAAATVSFIDSAGMSWIQWKPTVESVGALIFVDTNGIKKPNKFGQDRFPFAIVDKIGGSSTNTTPTTVQPHATDYTVYNAVSCPSGASHPCYYQSWLFD